MRFYAGIANGKCLYFDALDDWSFYFMNGNTFFVKKFGTSDWKTFPNSFSSMDAIIKHIDKTDIDFVLLNLKLFTKILNDKTGYCYQQMCCMEISEEEEWFPNVLTESTRWLAEAIWIQP